MRRESCMIAVKFSGVAGVKSPLWVAGEIQWPRQRIGILKGAVLDRVHGIHARNLHQAASISERVGADAGHARLGQAGYRRQSTALSEGMRFHNTTSPQAMRSFQSSHCEGKHSLQYWTRSPRPGRL